MSETTTPSDKTAQVRPTSIHAHGLVKKFGDVTVLDEVSMDVEPGQVVALIGPSGAGKSTFLRCINLLERPTSGTITVGDLTIETSTTVSSKQLSDLRRDVGMVFQSFNLFPHMSVLRNVALPQMRVLGRSKDEAESRAMDLLKRVGLAEKADQYPSRCSGGQQQRVAIARALALDPKAMLFDEPTSALDPELGLEVLEVMRELAAEGMTMLVVTHEMHFARDVSDHLVVMADGRIIEEGDPKQIFTDPAQDRTRRFLRAVLDR
ncbi:amino acid ABC transporter ATP-binding protein [Yimella sp. cx-51]|uniref:amino acid ABC transporter ATP-binding protein n=1 Tax=Yimella sp. cx-51 TaxID=2770551 RepID=UPI00165DBC81|nr:amino acid ABC transporter ATP-binding protein [Yimella sp. cx-51]MBC9955618.1 amino acid ABC transporter ATP-binding protein [Yimella sp. cx-51]QTH37806.1 amino acid ABC transporter ATP-binding protein [Yimella sp. cx-51]